MPGIVCKGEAYTAPTQELPADARRTGNSHAPAVRCGITDLSDAVQACPRPWRARGHATPPRGGDRLDWPSRSTPQAPAGRYAVPPHPWNTRSRGALTSDRSKHAPCPSTPPR